MPENGRMRVEIAFTGGQTVGAVTTPEAAEGLRQALAAGDGAYELESEEGAIVISLRAVTYVKRFSRETHIGFGLGV